MIGLVIFNLPALIASEIYGLKGGAMKAVGTDPYTGVIADINAINCSERSHFQSISGLCNHRPFSLFDIQYVNGLNKLHRSWRL